MLSCRSNQTRPNDQDDLDDQDDKDDKDDQDYQDDQDDRQRSPWSYFMTNPVMPQSALKASKIKGGRVKAIWKKSKQKQMASLKGVVY